MYRIKKDKVEELKEGKKTVYLSNLTGYTRQYLTYIFRGTLFVTKPTAEKLILSVAKESIKINEMVKNANSIDDVIKYFFDEDKEN